MGLTWLCVRAELEFYSKFQVFAPLSGVAVAEQATAATALMREREGRGSAVGPRPSVCEPKRSSCGGFCGTHPFRLPRFILLFVGFVTVPLTSSLTLHFHHVCSLFLLKSISLRR